MRGVVIQPDGTTTVQDVEATLEGLQALVGGYIEAVGMKCPTPVTAYINEEGKVHGLPLNLAATAVAHLFPGDYIAGPMVVLGAPDNEGNDTPLPDDALAWLGIGGNETGRMPRGGEVAPEDADDYPGPMTVGAVLRHKERAGR